MNGECRIIFRDSSGRYAWDFKPFYKSLDEIDTSISPLNAENMSPAILGVAESFKFSDTLFIRAKQYCSILKMEYFIFLNSDNIKEILESGDSFIDIQPDILEQLLLT